MKKKGFMLAEAVISTFVIMVSFVLLYSHFVVSYNASVKYSSYNNMEKLYLVHSFASYISDQTNVYNDWAKTLENNSYVDVIEYCKNPANVSDNRNKACLSILEKIGVNVNNGKANVIFIKNNPSDIRNNLGPNFTTSMKEFINYLSNATDLNYRLIIQFRDGNFGSLRINRL